ASEWPNSSFGRELDPEQEPGMDLRRTLDQEAAGLSQAAIDSTQVFEAGKRLGVKFSRLSQQASGGPAAKSCPSSEDTRCLPSGRLPGGNRDQMLHIENVQERIALF